MLTFALAARLTRYGARWLTGHLMTPENAQELSDEKLVALCQQGEGEYFEVLVRRYMEKAFRIAMDFTHNTEEAKDLSQDAFLRAYSRIKQFDGQELKGRTLKVNEAKEQAGGRDRSGNGGRSGGWERRY